MGPIDYSLSNVPNPQATFMQGLQQGTVINAAQQQMAMQQAQQQAAMAAQQRVQAVLGNPNSTHEDLLGVIAIMDPKTSAEVLKAREAADKSKAQAALGHGMQVVAALRSPSPEIGVRMLEDRATALENSGRPQDAARFREIAAQAKTNPGAASNLVGIGLAGLPGAKEAFESLGKLGAENRAEEQAPGALRKVNADAKAAESEAQTKAITAKYGEQSALLDLQKKGWDIKAVIGNLEFQRESNRIAAMNAAANREGNALRAQELGMKVKEAQRVLDEKVRERVAEAESAAFNTDNMLNTIERILAKPDVLASVVGTIQGRMPVLLSDDAASMAADIEQLGSQAFLSQIPLIKGNGNLSNSEGDKLQSGFQNFTRVRSEESMRAALEEGRRLLKKARASMERKHGVPMGKPDTPAAASTRPPLSAFGG